MKKRSILTTVVAFLLLAAVVAAGLNAVFTVTYVNADFVTYTQEGEQEAQQLKEQLNGYLGKSTTFLDLNEVRATASANPRFNVVRIEKKYPASVVIWIEERRSAFAYAAQDGYDVLDVEGIWIGKSAQSSGFVELKGDFSFTYESGRISGAYAQELIGMYAVMSELLGEPRANVLSLTFEDSGDTSSDRFDRFRIAMREGVEIVIGEPSVRAQDKVRAALAVYLDLTQSERVSGTINTAIVTSTGEAAAYYFPEN